MDAHNRRPQTRLYVIGLLWGVAVSFAGCSSLATNPGGGNPSDGGAPSDVPNPSELVTVHFRNLTFTNAVDVEFYLTDDPIEALPDALFVDAYRVRAGIGVAGTGIIEPQMEDVVELPCGPGLTLGTAGGVFLDNESGEQRGLGAARWAEEAALGFCGSTISFDFVQTSDMEFDTLVRIVD